VIVYYIDMYYTSLLQEVKPVEEEVKVIPKQVLYHKHVKVILY